MVDESWLADEEREAWMTLLASSKLLDVALNRQLQQDAGLSHSTYAILATLAARPGLTLHMGELAQLVNQSQSRLSHAVAGLESQGYVRRSPCPDSRRTIHATLTDVGEQRLADAAPGHVAAVREFLFDHVDAEQVRLMTQIGTEMMERIARAGMRVPGVVEHPRPDEA